MFNKLNLEIKKVETLEVFINNNQFELYSYFNKLNRVELLELKKEFKTLILFNKKVFRQLDLSNLNNFEFIIFLIKITNDLFLNMEFKLLVNLLENNFPKDIYIANKYMNFDTINEFYDFNKEILTLLKDIYNTNNKKYINNILVDYYLNLIKSFNSKELLDNYKDILSKNVDFVEINLFNQIFNNVQIEVEILTIFDNYNFSTEIKKSNNNSIVTTIIPNNTIDTSKHKFKPTDEQAEIIKTSKKMKQGQVLIIEALAGCTKTSTLEMITNENSDKRFLYLAFNTKIVEDARKRFPKNTEVKTLHALAFKYEGRGKTLVKNINYIIADLFNLDISKDFYKIYDINNVYDKFCNSENTIYQLDKLEERLIKDIEEEFKHKDENQQYKKNFFIKKIKDVIPFIERLYNHMITSEVISHSTYLKKFVENIEKYPLEYDFIVLDESQDVSRLLGKFMINTVLSYKYKVVIVGDNNQKIYGFLGNINLPKGIRKIVDNTIYIEKNLTKTFRFSKNTYIENLTNLILNLRDSPICGAKPNKVSLKKDYQLTKAYLSRGKIPILLKALYCVESNIDFNLFMDKEKDFDIDLIIDIYELYRYTMVVKKKLISNNKIDKKKFMGVSIPTKNKKQLEDFIEIFKYNKEDNLLPKFINKKFKNVTSIYELEYESDKNNISDNLEALKIVYFIVLNYDFFDKLSTKHIYPHIVDKSLSFLIEEVSNDDSLNIISTIHKVKGLEFEKVTIIEGSIIVKHITIESKDDDISLFSSTGGIMGLCDTAIDTNCKKRRENNNSNENSISSNINFGDVFDSDDNINNKRITLDDIKKEADNNIPSSELLIDKNIDIQEEYNILYVGITRAEMSIEINNLRYNDTLVFLQFIENNKIEIENIINNKYSDLLIERSDKEKGIIYKSSFISSETLKEFLFQFKYY